MAASIKVMTMLRVGVLLDITMVFRKGVMRTAKKLGFCSILLTEMRGICEGILQAWNLGFKRVIIESDSLGAINLIKVALDGKQSAGGVILVIVGLI